MSGIALNYYLSMVTGEDGTPKLFGKCGYQTMSQKADKYILSNLSAIERALDAGQLTDLNGQPVTDNAFIQIFAQVKRVQAADSIAQVAVVRNATGVETAIPAALPKAAAPGDQPF